ncbi:uncharacterized protein LOC120624301 [Pararge aegeria]|uniref:uncharacterized protein LOC120624301 n=1 Tax=Pararge aegeria TaxID=116150 RepID=UPI0019D24448|nr:uncharacterized protein LOC120624301 [Pararge aegeria]
MAQTNKSVPMKCSFCGDSHPISQCQAFLSKSVAERITITTEKGWCYNCLKESHQLRNCVSIFRCLKCKAKHHTLICDMNKEDYCVTDSESVSLVAGNSSHVANTTVLLATTSIQIKDVDGKYHQFRAIFDTGSQNSIITQSAAQRLNVEPVPGKFNIKSLGGVAVSITGKIHCNVAANNHTLFGVDMHVMPTICGDHPSAKLQTQGWSHIHSLTLADPGFDTPGPIDVLLGADVFANSLLNDIIKGDEHQPLAINSLFGWLLVGRAPLVNTILPPEVLPNSTKLVYVRPDQLSSLPQKEYFPEPQSFIDNPSSNINVHNLRAISATNTLLRDLKSSNELPDQLSAKIGILPDQQLRAALPRAVLSPIQSKYEQTDLGLDRLGTTGYGFGELRKSDVNSWLVFQPLF